jgi:hypothetical protein
MSVDTGVLPARGGSAPTTPALRAAVPLPRWGRNKHRLNRLKGLKSRRGYPAAEATGQYGRPASQGGQNDPGERDGTECIEVFGGRFHIPADMALLWTPAFARAGVR